MTEWRSRIGWMRAFGIEAEAEVEWAPLSFMGDIGFDETPELVDVCGTPRIMWIDEIAEFTAEQYEKLAVSLQSREALMGDDIEDVLARFDSVACDGEQIAAINQLREAAKVYATLIVELCPGGRNKARALTALEDSSVCAIKAVAHRT